MFFLILNVLFPVSKTCFLVVVLIKLSDKEVLEVIFKRFIAEDSYLSLLKKIIFKFIIVLITCMRMSLCAFVVMIKVSSEVRRRCRILWS